MLVDFQLLDFGIQRRTGNAQLGCGTVWTGNSSARSGKGRLNHFFLLLFQGLGKWGGRFGWEWLDFRGQPCVLDSESLPTAQDYGAFNDILQFPDVARPGICLAKLHGVLV